MTRDEAIDLHDILSDYHRDLAQLAPAIEPLEEGEIAKMIAGALASVREDFIQRHLALAIVLRGEADRLRRLREGVQ